jgi:hypothetical protein
MRHLNKLFFLATAVLSCLSFQAQTYSNIISDQEIYDFLNWMTIEGSKYSEEPKWTKKRVSRRIYNWNASHFVLDTNELERPPNMMLMREYLYKSRGGLDTLFTQKDRDFHYKQFTEIKDNVWHKQFSKSKLLIFNKQVRPNRYYYSIPLFSMDKKYVVVNRVYYCGPLCAHGGCFVFRKLDNDQWEFVTAVNTWIS